MKLTKLQRYTAYCILLEEAERPSDFWGFVTTDVGFCYIWYTLTGDGCLFKRFKTELPELFSKRKIEGIYFFRNWKERIAALKACIKETEPK